MLKNSVIFVLAMVLGVMSYKYFTTNKTYKVVEKEVITVTSDTGNIKLYKESKISFSIISDDDKFKCFFIYDKNGFQTVSIHDNLTGRSIAFNISAESGLESYLYEDKKYRVVTNIDGVEADKMIQREEWYNGYRINYELLTDGSTNLTVKSAGLGEW